MTWWILVLFGRETRAPAVAVDPEMERARTFLVQSSTTYSTDLLWTIINLKNVNSEL